MTVDPVPVHAGPATASSPAPAGPAGDVLGAALHHASGWLGLTALALHDHDGRLLAGLPLRTPVDVAAVQERALPAGRLVAVRPLGWPADVLAGLDALVGLLAVVAPLGGQATAHPAAPGVPAAPAVPAPRAHPAAPADLVARLLGLGDAERREAAHCLHDGPMQALVAARYAADLAALRVKAATADRADAAAEEARTAAAGVRDVVQQGLVEARRTLWRLRPQAADGRDLAGALQVLADWLRDGGQLRVTVEAPEPPGPLPALAAVTTYRLVQESLDAAVGRGAVQATVSVRTSGGALRVDVADDGPGQLVEVPAALARARERAEILGGTVWMRGRRGGALLELDLPLCTVPASPAALPAEETRSL